MFTKMLLPYMDVQWYHCDALNHSNCCHSHLLKVLALLEILCFSTCVLFLPKDVLILFLCSVSN